MNKTTLKHNLRDELSKLRQRVADLEAEGARYARTIAEIRETAEKYRRFVEDAREGIWAINAAAVTTFVNPCMAEMLGYTAEEMAGKRLLSFVEDRDVEPAARYLKHYQSRAGQRQDFAFRRKDGTVVFTSLYTSPIINNKGECAGAIAFVEDITERTWAEEALRRSEEYSATILNNSPSPIFVANPDSSIRYVNPAFEVLTGFSLIELIGRKTPYPWWPEEASDKILERYKQATRHGVKAREELFRKKNGQNFWVEVTATPVSMDGEFRYYLASWVDITERKRTEEELQKSKDFSYGLIASMQDGLSVLDTDGVHIDVNHALCEMTGFSREELIGIRTPHPYWAPEAYEEINRAFRKTLRGELASFELTFIRKDGERFPVIVSPSSVKDEQGNVVSYVATVKDITKRKKAEAGLQRERDRAQHYLDIAGVMLVAINPAGNVTLINKMGCEILGYKEPEIIGKNWFRHFLPGNVRKEVQAVFNKLVAGELKPAEYYENPVLTKDGRVRLIAWQNTVLRDAAGSVTGTLSSGEDITERRIMLDKLRESEQKYHAIFTEARDGIVLVDAETGRIADCNPEFERQTGRKLAQLKKMKVWKLRPPEKVEAARQKFLEVREKGKGESEGLEFLKPDGKLVHIEFTARAVTIKGKRYLQSMVRDITKRKKAEEALQLRAHLLNETTDSIIATDLKGNIIYMNEATCRTRGYSKEEMLTMNLKQLVPPEMAHFIDDRLRRVQEEGAIAIESKHLRKNGSIFPVESTARIVNLGDQTIILSVIRDITERTRAEEALRESEERYRALLELGERIGEAVVMLQDDERGVARHVYASEEWSRITGYSKEELSNMSILDLFHPEDRKEAAKRHKRRMRGEILPGLYEATIIRKDGSEISVEGTYAYSTYKGKAVNVGYIRDISERKKMEEQLIVTDRLASIGELASGVAHELNNPLTGIIGFSELLLNKDVPDDVREDLKVINREAQRTSQVVRNLLTFARKHDTTKKPVDINKAIKSVLDLRAYEQNVHNIEVVANFDTSLPEITADIFRLQQVFVNIIINAEYFMVKAHGRGTLTITTERKGDIIRASFADDGPGIKEEHMIHLFDPFFTTKEVGKGTGLGLSICHGIITEHGGNIYAESRWNKGATFIVELPVK